MMRFVFGLLWSQFIGGMALGELVVSSQNSGFLVRSHEGLGTRCEEVSTGKLIWRHEHHHQAIFIHNDGCHMATEGTQEDDVVKIWRAGALIRLIKADDIGLTPQKLEEKGDLKEWMSLVSVAPDQLLRMTLGDGKEVDFDLRTGKRITPAFRRIWKLGDGEVSVVSKEEFEMQRDWYPEKVDRKKILPFALCGTADGGSHQVLYFLNEKGHAENALLFVHPPYHQDYRFVVFRQTHHDGLIKRWRINDAETKKAIKRVKEILLASNYAQTFQETYRSGKMPTWLEIGEASEDPFAEEDSPDVEIEEEDAIKHINEFLSCNLAFLIRRFEEKGRR